ncbi:MAG: tetratricopeptide repeat protein [Verrucomicrobiota bacterium]|nr:tetratricopeptide repeat protein [Verrucomicrobiota bacterium]
MTKAVSVSLGFILLVTAAVAPAQTNSTELAVNRALLNQANTILLRQKLVQAREAVDRKDLIAAAELYEEAWSLVQEIGSGIDVETSQTVSGLVSVRLELARRAQERRDYRAADEQVSRALKVAPHDPEALAFKKQNDKILASLRGQIPDVATQEQLPMLRKQKTDAGTLARDGQMLYEMGKYEDAQVKLEQALALDPNNQGAYYYLNLVKQAEFSRAERKSAVDNESRLVKVAEAWQRPTPTVPLPVPNPYADNSLVHTGPGREAIMDKLTRIRLDSFGTGPQGLPLSEVVHNLSEQSKLRDPDKKGINFLINPNVDMSTSYEMQSNALSSPYGPNVPNVAPGGGAPGAFPGAAPTINPQTGLPMAATPAPSEQPVDVNGIIIKIDPPLTDVRLADVLDAVEQVAAQPIKYTVTDYAIVFSAKGPETPLLFTRTFRVDPNTFYQGLESVSAFTFGSTYNTSGGGGGLGGGGGGGGGGQNGQNVTGAVVPVVNVAPGSGNLRNQGGTGGGGGGGAGGQGAYNPLSNIGGVGGAGGAGGAGAGNVTQQGGLRYVTTVNLASDVSVAARDFFSTLGVDLSPPKSIFFNDRLGLLFVHATMQDLDTIEGAIQALNQVAPQVHIKSRFVEVQQNDNAGLGFDWYLGQFNVGGHSVVAQGGNAGSLNVPPSAANPTGGFPGNNTVGTVAGTVQSLTQGLNNSSLPAVGTITGILTDPNFQVVLHALEQRQGFQELAEPEVTTTSGRQTEMRATTIQTIVTSYSFQQGTAATTTAGTP